MTIAAEAGAGISPFPGLRPFEEQEDFLFFGREGQSDKILEAMRRTRLLAVVGASGSGKSSLIRAGLIPYLHGGFLGTDGARWRVAVMRPGADPIGALAQAIVRQELLAAKPADLDEIHRRVLLTGATLRRSGFGLVDTIKLARLPASETILIVVDQFEELFRFGEAAGAKSSDEAAAFVKLLLEAARQTAAPIYIVLTMRSDFIGECARFRDLPETVTRGLYLVPRLTRAQRREVIEGPVHVVGGEVTPRLVTRVLNDIGDDPDQLPILQHAMMRAWNHWLQIGDRARPLDLADYEAIGGAADALSQHADELYNSLDGAGQRIAQRIFQSLTEKDADNREARRPTQLGLIAAVAGASLEETRAVLETFRAPGHSFVMPAPPTPLEPQTAVDISHESLIRGWRRLRAWVEEEGESARVYKRLAETAALADEGKAGLWRDPDLAVALAWREREQPTAAWASRYHPGWDSATRFLDESFAAREAAARAAAEARYAAIRRSRVILIFSLIGAVVFAALALIGYYEAQAANEQRVLATKATAVADERRREALTALKQARDERARADEQRHLAEQAKETAQQQKTEAEAEKARAEQTSRDLIAEADRALGEDLRLATYLKYVASLAKETAARQSAVYINSALNWATLMFGEFDEARRNLQQQAKTGVSPKLTASTAGYVAVMQGDADTAVRVLGGYVERDKDPIYLFDLADALAMRGDYVEALKALDAAVTAKNATPEATNGNIAPDIKAATHHRELAGYGDDVILAALYMRTFIYAFEDRDAFDEFRVSLDTADDAYARSGAGLDPTDAVNPLLIAIDHGWLAARGQAISLPGLQASAPQPANYGAFAAQGAIWERAGATQSRYWYAAKQAYLAFEAAFAARPADRYRRLDAWVRGRLAQPQIRDAIDQYVAPDPAALAVEADEIKYHADGASYFEIKPAMDRLDEAIGLLTDSAKAQPLKPQQRFQLADLYLKRGSWKADAQDLSGARSDADKAIALNGALSDAYVLRARSETDPARRVGYIERALGIRPGDADALSWLADDVSASNPKRAIEALEQKRQFATMWVGDNLRLANLQFGEKNFAAAAAAIDDAIDEAPARADLCGKRREIDLGSGLDPAAAGARAAACLRQGAEAAARIGQSALAVKLQLQALRAADGPAPRSDDEAFEQRVAARGLSALLSREFGAVAAGAFWDALAQEKTTATLVDQAKQERARIGGR